jgi:hypothetical protein
MSQLKADDWTPPRLRHSLSRSQVDHDHRQRNCLIQWLQPFEQLLIRCEKAIFPQQQQQQMLGPAPTSRRCTYCHCFFEARMHKREDAADFRAIAENYG